MNSYIELRREFDEAFGLLNHPLNKQLQYEMAKEEIEEYRDALMKLDKVEIADALGDILVIELGKANAHGFLDKIIFINEDETEAETPYLRIPAVFEACNYEYLVTENITPFHIQRVINLTLNTAAFFNIDIERVYKEIMRSNMSKIDDNNKPIINGVTIYDGNNLTTSNLLHVEGEVIFDETRPHGKVLKSINFSEPDLKFVLDA